MRMRRGSTRVRAPKRPVCVKILMLDLLWRAGGATRGGSRGLVLDPSCAARRGNTPGPMMWARLQRWLREVQDGEATID